VSTIDGESLIKIAIHSFEKSRHIESAMVSSRRTSELATMKHSAYILSRSVGSHVRKTRPAGLSRNSGCGFCGGTGTNCEACEL